MAKLFEDRGVVLDRTYQLNVGGNMDFKNMLERERLESKKISKTQAVTSNLTGALAGKIDDRNVHIGPSDYVAWLDDRKWAYVRLEGRAFGDVPLNLEYKLEVWDSPNSAGIIIDAIRAAKIAKDRGIGGADPLGVVLPDEVPAGAAARRPRPRQARGLHPRAPRSADDPPPLSGHPVCRPLTRAGGIPRLCRTWGNAAGKEVVDRSMKVDIWSDVVCPFCYIGKRRLEEALGAASHTATTSRSSGTASSSTPARQPSPRASTVDMLAAKYGMTREQAIASRSRWPPTRRPWGWSSTGSRPRPATPWTPTGSSTSPPPSAWPGRDEGAPAARLLHRGRADR